MKLAIILIFFCGVFACVKHEGKIDLQSGDLLFRGASSENISQAIDQVTQTSAATHFSHVGIVEVLSTGIFVLHASPVGGTWEVSIKEFLHPKGDSVTVIAYRLKDQLQAPITPGPNSSPW